MVTNARKATLPPKKPLVTGHYEGPTLALTHQRAFGEGKRRSPQPWVRKVWRKGKWEPER